MTSSIIIYDWRWNRNIEMWGGNEIEMRRNRNGNGGGNEMEMRWNGGNDHSATVCLCKLRHVHVVLVTDLSNPRGRGWETGYITLYMYIILCRHLHTHNTQLYPGQLQAEAVLQAGDTVVKIHGGGFATDAYSSYNLVYIGNIPCQVN